MALGKYLKKARKRRRLSQWDLAKLVGYRRGQTISQWETGKTPVPIKKYPMLVRALGLVPIELINETPRKSRFDAIDELTEAGLVESEYEDGGESLFVADTAGRPTRVASLVPVVVTISGGPDASMIWEPLENEDPLDYTECQAARVRGDSMSPVAWDGQYAIFHPGREVRDGDLAVISLEDGEIMFKRIFHDDENNLLICESVKEGHRPRNVKLDDVKWAHKVIGVRF